MTAKGYRVSLRGDGKVPKLIMMMIARPCERTKNTDTCALGMGELYGM